jgi:iron complex outermembrane recepter protein
MKTGLDMKIITSKTERLLGRLPRRSCALYVSAVALMGAHGARAAEPAEATADAPSLEIEEVTVTAQKRTENIKDVPINVSVMSGDQLQERQITSLSDLSHIVPDLSNASAAGGPGQGNYVIRGISGTGGFGGVGQATVATYIDDVSMTVPTGASGVGSTELKIFDLDRVEVLRGPQGTLYGSSSMGGTIRFITHQPDLNSFGGSALAEVSNTDHGGMNYLAQGVVNIPITPGVLAIRVGAQFSDQSGYIDAVNPAQPSQVTQNNINDDRSTVVRATMKYQAPDQDLTITPSFLMQRETFGAAPVYDLGTPFEMPQYVLPRSDDNSTIPSLTVEAGVLGAEFTSVSSYFSRDSNFAQDRTFDLGAPLTAGTLFWPTPFYIPNHLRQYSEEMRLASKSMKESGLPVTWLAGLYLQKQEENTYPDAHTTGSIASFQQALINSGNSALESSLATYTPQNDIYSAATHYQQYQSSVFGEVSYAPLERLTLTGGFRELIAHLTQTDAVGGYYTWFGPNQGTQVTSGSTKARQLTPKAAVLYQVSDSVNVYANAVQGFRLGGVNQPITLSDGCLAALAEIGRTSGPLDYGADKLWSYELGIKGSLFNNRVTVDTSLFYIDWNGVQQGITLRGTPTSPCSANFVANAGQAKSEGVDFDVQGKVTEHFTLSVKGNVTHAVITHAALDTGTEDGSHLLGVPNFSTVFAGTYSTALSNALTGFASMDLDWIGRSYGSFDATSPAYDFPSYELLNATAGVDIGSVRVSLFAQNLLNTDKDIQPQPNPYSGPTGLFYLGVNPRPRTVGLSASTKF